MGWSLFSPGMVTPLGDRSLPLVEQDATMDALLSELDRRPAALRRELAARRDRRLGHRFETFWSFYLHRHSFYQVLAENLRIEGDGRTLGALDLLLRDTRRDKVVHLELAVKFYLFVAGAPGDGAARWLGTNPDDTLQHKIDHLLSHQLPLSSQPRTLQLLKSRGLPAPDEHCALIKGYLFHPSDGAIATPPPINPEHLRGLWVHGDRREELVERFPDSRWQILDKSRWLDPAPPGACSWPAMEGSLKASLDRGEPVMVHHYPASGQTDSRRPARCLVMPPGWPR